MNSAEVDLIRASRYDRRTFEGISERPRHVTRLEHFKEVISFAERIIRMFIDLVVWVARTKASFHMVSDHFATDGNFQKN